MLTVDVPYFCDGTIQVPASLANCQAAWQDSRQQTRPTRSHLTCRTWKPTWDKQGMAYGAWGSCSQLPLCVWKSYNFPNASHPTPPRPFHNTHTHPRKSAPHGRMYTHPPPNVTVISEASYCSPDPVTGLTGTATSTYLHARNALQQCQTPVDGGQVAIEVRPSSQPQPALCPTFTGRASSSLPPSTHMYMQYLRYAARLIM